MQENYTNYINKISSCSSICLLGSGNSLSKYVIDFDQYDIVIGTNRMHNTDLLQYIDVLYHNASQFDKNMQQIDYARKVITQLDYIIFVPAEPNSFINRYRHMHNWLLNEYPDKPIVDFDMQKKYTNLHGIRLLTGVCALASTMQFTELKFNQLDIYGFDFYTEGYYGELPLMNTNKVHNIKRNIEIFQSLTNKDNVNWFA